MKLPPLSPLRLKNPNNLRLVSTATPNTPSQKPNSSPNVTALVNEISSLTLLELSTLTQLLLPRLNLSQLPTLAVIPFGASFSGAASGSSPAPAEKDAEEKKEKTAFDVKLEGFDAAAKIKVIKEVRGFTSLGLKEAKELVEKAPVVVKGGVSKDEAEGILEKLKAIGAKVALE